MVRYYVYEFWDRAANIPFYVGKGKGSRCFHSGRNDAVESRISKLCNKHEIRIVLRTKVEKEALDLERKLIEKYGSEVQGTGTLLNIALVPTPAQAPSETPAGKNWKSPWHLARSGGTKEEILELQLAILRKVGEEIRENPTWKQNTETGKYLL